MSNKPDFSAAASLAAQLVTDHEIACRAAANKASGQIFKMEVHDKHIPEIVVGHMLVVCVYGSESATAKVMEAVEPLVHITGVTEGEFGDGA